MIADGKPQQLGLMEIIRHYVAYQRQVILRRTKFDLNEAESRCHVLEGLIIAVRNIDEVIAIIKSAESTADARAKLMKRFELTEIQAQAILDLRLARLTKLEVFKLEEELKELKKLIKKLTAISKSKDLQLQVVKEEISEIRDKYPTPRRSRLVFTGAEADDLLAVTSEKVPGAKCALVRTADEKIKVLTGKNADALSLPVSGKFKAGVIAEDILSTVTDKVIYAFTNFGNLHRLNISDAALSCKLSDEGVSLAELSPGAVDGEKCVKFFEIGDKFPVGNLLFFTAKGMVKKSSWEEYEGIRKDVLQAVKVADDDELIAVEEEREEEETMLFVTEQGYCLNALKNDIPLQGRVSGGVKGIMLRDGDKVKFVSQVNGEGEIVIVTSEGKFKKVISSQIDVSGRYKKGSMIVALPDGAKVLSASYVTVPYKIAVVEKGNKISCISSEDVPIAMQSAKARKISAYDEGSVIAAYPLRYQTEE